jgi:regulator of protease activity HflC (stomatin/prohibitin superfamily)
MGLLITIIIILVIYLLGGLRVINQYQQGIVLTLGRFTSVRKPGLQLIFPIFQHMIRVDMRTNTIDIPKQEVITKDNVTVNVDAVVYFRVTDAPKAIFETTNYIYASTQLAQAALRDVTGNVELDSLLGKRDEVSAQIKDIVDHQTEAWGLDVMTVKVQNIELPADMKRAMAKQAEAERERRAVIITADGEKAAAKAVAEAAAMLTKIPGGINIRTLQTLEKIAVEPSQKTLFVLPADLTDAISRVVKNNS